MDENARVIFATGLRRHLRIQPSLSIGALPANPGGERLACIEPRVLRFLLAIGTQPANPGRERLVFSGSLSETICIYSIGALLTVPEGDDGCKIFFFQN
jgi:hypothetical protein